ncbi:hypothetical protein BDF20DRAFT_908661 [Mycotypha africana]|uniref:uncharacterized protein n=1 Tax=Mycotypha africana TaxID=64632 RepID=UPI002301AFC3|nr:uncharacterized protein BDF20DRAFT_908661 [Mycotypha africana]KAI8990815.1 hypothetical protein BDF20DRAFT_908661 [Mycotypha africana]
MSPALDIKLKITFDNSNNDSRHIRYFPGDTVEGKILLTANQAFTLRNFRLAWTGRIQVQPIPSNKESRIYFDECWKLSPHLIKSRRKATISKAKKTSGWMSSSHKEPRRHHIPYYYTQLIPLSEVTVPEPKIELQKNKTLGLTFKVRVPNDRPLPSSTQTTYLPNRILYLLEAFIDSSYSNNEEGVAAGLTEASEDEETEMNRTEATFLKKANSKKKKKGPVFFTQQVVPVFEPIYTHTAEMTVPLRAEQTYVVSLMADLRKDFTAALRVTVPCRGSEPGLSIPVSITLWNTMEVCRRQGISIALCRVHMALANGRAYASESETIQRVVTDLNMTASETHTKEFAQTVHAYLPIPKGTTPTITFEKSQLMSVSYFIRIQVFAQEGTYTTPNGKKSQFMSIDLPFIIGTLPSPATCTVSGSPSGMSQCTSPTSISSSSQYSIPTPTSPTCSSFTSMTSSPTILQPSQQQQHYLPSFNSSHSNHYPMASNNRIFRKISSGSTTTSVSSAPSHENTATTGSNSSFTSSSASSIAANASALFNTSDSMQGLEQKPEQKQKKKSKSKNVFSKLRLYTGSSHSSSTEETIQQKEPASNATYSHTMTLPNDPLTRETLRKEEERRVEQKSVHCSHVKNDKHKNGSGGFQGGVFNLFPDDDFTDTEEEEAYSEGEDNSATTATTLVTDIEAKEGQVQDNEAENMSAIVFYPFVDSDTDLEGEDKHPTERNNHKDNDSLNMSLFEKLRDLRLMQPAEDKDNGHMKPNEYDHHKANTKEASVHTIASIKSTNAAAAAG